MKVRPTISQDEVKWLFAALRKIRFFSCATIDTVDEILSRFMVYSYRKDETVIKEGDNGIALYIIKTGSCLVYHRKGLFSEEPVAKLKSGDFCGEMSLLFGDRTSASVKTLEPSEIFVYLKSDFMRLVSENLALQTLVKKTAEQRRSASSPHPAA